MHKWPLEPRIYAKIKEIDEQIVEVEETLLCDSAETVSDTGTILELNPYQGRSTAILALACPGKSQQIYCIDQWNHIYLQLWLDNMTALGVHNVVLPLRGEPLDVLQVMGPHLATKRIELVLLHGRQGLKELLATFTTALSFLQPGNRIIVHKTVDSSVYFNQFWEIASKILRKPESTESMYYGTKP